MLTAVSVLMMTIGGCADTLILHPPGPMDAGPAEREVIQAAGKSIELWTALSPSAQAGNAQMFVLEFCGNATRAEQIAPYVAMRWGSWPVEVWVMNYPGYGGSDGPAKLSAIAPAALAAFDSLKTRAGDRPIFLEANSLGTTAALYVASQRSVAGLVLQDPPPLRSLIVRRYGWWNLWLIAAPVAMQIPAELDGPSTAAKVKAPAVFLLADQDEVVPPEYHRMVLDAYAGPKRIVTMRGAGHNDSVTGQAETELQDALTWLMSHRAAPR
jgi:pimeloyl-ACP methyl ester carboxylesterase